MTHFCNCNKKYPTDGYCGACGRDIEPKTKCNSLGCWIEDSHQFTIGYNERTYSYEGYEIPHEEKEKTNMINTMAQPSCKEITDHKLWTSKMNFSIWMKDNSSNMTCIHVGGSTTWKLGDITTFDHSLVPFQGKVVIEED